MNRPIALRWEGAFFNWHSLAHVNRELCLRLLASGRVELSLLPTEPPEFDGAADPRLAPLAARIGAPLAGQAQVHVRHCWPPRLEPRAEGRLVLMQPWEFGSLPAAWIAPIKRHVAEVWCYSAYVREVYRSSGIPPEMLHLVPLGASGGIHHRAGYLPGGETRRGPVSEEASGWSTLRPAPAAATLPGASGRPSPSIPCSVSRHLEGGYPEGVWLRGSTSAKPFVFLFAGGTIRRKGIDILLAAYLRAFSASDDVALVIKDTGTRRVYAGQNAREPILALAQDRTRPRIIYLDDDLPCAEMAELYTAADVLVQPYRGEGFCLPALEAMACGRPVVVTAGGPTDDFVDETVGWRLPAERQSFPTNRVGDLECVGRPWLFEPSPDDLAALLRELMRNPAEVQRRGAAAALRAQEWSWERSATIALERLEALGASGDWRLQLDPTPATPSAAVDAAQPSDPLPGSLPSSDIEHPVACAQPRRSSSQRPASIISSPECPTPDAQRLPLISLCMIVREEERVLGDCLASVKPFVEEMIVVDTGSTDGTIEIAERFGAKVVRIAWPDSFAAARNESLKHATGRWVLCVDADDTLPPESGVAIRAAALHAPPEVAGFVIPVQFVEDGTAASGTRVDHVKLFRNLPGLAFEGRIHEQIVGSIRALGGQIARLNAVVLHSGYDTSPEGQAKKRERDRKLLELELAERPEHPFVHFNLGMTAHYNGEHEAAIGWLRKSIGRAEPTESHVRKAHALLAVSLRELGREAESRETLAEGLAAVPGDPELHFHSGLALTACGRLAEAKAHYLAALKADASGFFSSFDIGILGHKSFHNLAGVCMAMGDYLEAQAWWLKAVEAAPQFLPSAFELFNAALANGDRSAAQQAMEAVRRVEGFSENWANMGVRYAEAGGASAEALLRNALAADPAAVGARLVLARQLLQAERVAEAQEHLRILNEAGVAEAAYCLGVCAIRAGDFPRALGWMERAGALSPGHAETQAQIANLKRAVEAARTTPPRDAREHSAPNPGGEESEIAPAGRLPSTAVGQEANAPDAPSRRHPPAHSKAAADLLHPAASVGHQVSSISHLASRIPDPISLHPRSPAVPTSVPEPTICAVILARNEEHRIEAALRSVLWADQILVIDNESEDGTVRIARRYTANILTAPRALNFDGARNLAVEAAHTGWLLFLDADERFPGPLAPILRQLIAERGHEFAGLCLPFKHYFCGKWMQHSGWWPGYKGPQLVRRDRFRYQERLHGGAIVEGPVLLFPAEDPELAVVHHSYDDLGHYLEKMARYTAGEAENLAADGEPHDWQAMLAGFVRDWQRYYEQGRGDLDGMHGFVLAFMSGVYRFVSRARLWDLRRTSPPTPTEVGTRLSTGGEGESRSDGGEVPRDLREMLAFMAQVAGGGVGSSVLGVGSVVLGDRSGAPSSEHHAAGDALGPSDHPAPTAGPSPPSDPPTSSSQHHGSSPPHPSPPRSVPLLLRAPLFDASGYGDAARNLALALIEAGEPVALNPEPWPGDAGLPPAARRCLEERVVPEATPAVVRLHFTLLGRVAPAPAATGDVARTMFETDRLPPGAAERLNAFDRIWVPSEFNRETFARSGVDPQKIAVVPEAIDPAFLEEVPPEEFTWIRDPHVRELLEARAALCSSGAERAVTDANRGVFVFLSVFDWSLHKGWDVLLEAFVCEFATVEASQGSERKRARRKKGSAPSRPASAPPQGSVPNSRRPAALLIKTWSSNGYSLDAIRSQVDALLCERFGRPLAAFPNIVLWEERLSTEDLPRLYRSVDAFVLPTRGEGWCRPLMEAMAAGLPTIATAWSGVTEFHSAEVGYPLTYRLAPVSEAGAREIPPYAGHCWAEPDPEDLRRLLRRVIEEPEEARAKGRAAREAIARRYSRPVVAAIAQRELASLRAHLTPVPTGRPLSTGGEGGYPARGWVWGVRSQHATLDWSSAPPFGRRAGLLRALRHLYALKPGPACIVETGTIRDGRPQACQGDGWSTLAWGWYAAQTGGRAYTVDTDAGALALCRRITAEYAGSIEYVPSDSVEFLRRWSRVRPGTIDLLYLDSLDYFDPDTSEAHALSEAAAAMPALAPSCLVLFDDTHPAGPATEDETVPLRGKGTRAVPYLLAHGFHLVSLEEGQALLSRERSAGA